MEALSELKNRGKYIIIQVLGDKKLVRHLAEMGMIAGKAVTVVSVSAESSGLVIFFSGAATRHQC